jgi:hypothetical protein
MRFFAALVLIFLGAFTGTALAADAVSAADPSMSELMKSLFDAVTSSNWWAAAAVGVMLAVAGARKGMPASWKTGTKGDIIGVSAAFLTAFAGAVMTWALAPGAVMSAGVILTALKIGGLAVGGFTVLHKVATWLVAWGKLPAWMLPMLKLITMLIGSNAMSKADSAGDKAVIANPPKGMAGDKQIVEIE